MKKYTVKTKNFDLEETLTCGQTFAWHRINGQLYQDKQKSNWFYTFRNDKPLMVKQKDKKRIKVKTKLEEQKEVEKALGLDHNLKNIFNKLPEDQELKKAKQKLWGLRILNDEFFPTTISYLLSPQMRIPRIKEMYNKIAENYGKKINFDQHTLVKFPDPKTLEKVSEDQLRDLGVGYRAKYIDQTTTQFLEKDINPEQLEQENFKTAKEKVKNFYGVGDKVADCILLFSLDFKQATPLDTWAKKALKQFYPELHTEKYEETAENIREYFGEHAGYAQEYLFHAARTGILEVEN